MISISKLDAVFSRERSLKSLSGGLTLMVILSQHKHLVS